MKISVVIPVYNEEECITQCLEALFKNTVKPYEIILVDGGSTDNTIKLAEKFSVKIIRSPGEKAASSRNIGIRYATGDIIAFTDGDCIVSNNWIEEIFNGFKQKNIEGLGGCVKPAPARNNIEEFWGNFSLNEIMSFGNEEYKVVRKTLNNTFITANCAYKRSLLVQLGGFNDWFGNNAEDVDLFWRAIDSGAKLKYIPSIKVEARSVTTLSGIKKKSFRNGISSSKLQKKYGSFFNCDINIYKLFIKKIVTLVKGEKWSYFYIIELIYHLLGKYYGSFIAKVINI